MIAELPDASARTCALCDEKLELMRAVIDHDGNIIHMLNAGAMIAFGTTKAYTCEVLRVSSAFCPRQFRLT